MQRGRKTAVSVRSQVRAASGLRSHKDTAYNNEKTPFDFTVENYKRVNAIMAKYPTHYKQA